MLSERSAHVGESDGDADDQSHVRPASSALLEGDSPRPINDSDDLFARRDELPLDELVAAVNDRNPSLQAAMAAWNAAANRYPQAIALDDPMFQSMYAPATWNAASNVQGSYYFGVATPVFLTQCFSQNETGMLPQSVISSPQNSEGVHDAF